MTFANKVQRLKLFHFLYRHLVVFFTFDHELKSVKISTPAERRRAYAEELPAWSQPRTDR